jgi:hypothetical protein
MSARMDNSIPSILWRLRSSSSMLHCVGNAMADIDANKNCVAYLAAILGELGDDLDDLDTAAMCAEAAATAEAREGLA